MRAGRPWNATRSRASRIQRAQRRRPRETSRERRAVGRGRGPRGSPERTAQRNGPLPSQKSGRMYSGTNPGMSNASSTPAALRLRADVVAVVEDDRAALPQGRAWRARGSPSSASTSRRSARDRPARMRKRRVEREAAGNVAVQRVVGGRLIGHDVGMDPAPHQLREDLGSVRAERERAAALAPFALESARERVVESCRLARRE